MQPSDSPAASAAALVPLAVGLPRAVRFSAPARRAYGNAGRVGRLGCGSSASPPIAWTNRGLPGYWVIRTDVPCSATPPRGIPPRPVAVVSPAAFSVVDRLGFPGSIAFRGWIRTAHLLACLRINRGVTTPTARLATDLRGYALVGRDLHPLDDKPNFRSHRMTPSFRTSIAWSLPMMQRRGFFHEPPTARLVPGSSFGGSAALPGHQPSASSCWART